MTTPDGTSSPRPAGDLPAASQHWYRLLFQHMSQGAFWQRADGQLIDANPAAERILGLSREQLLSRTSESAEWDVVDESGTPLPPAQHPSMRALATGEPVTGAVIGVRRAGTGERVWLEVNAVPEFEGGDTRPAGVLVTVHDVTARRRAEEALREKEAAIAFSIDAIAIAGLDGHLRYVNRAFVDLWGLESEADAVGRPAVSFWASPEAAATVMAAALDGGSWFGELEALRSDGSGCPVQVSAAMFTDAAGRPAGLLASFVDVTERRRAAEERERLREQLAQAQKMESVGRLAGGVAHDFNNMLAVILGHAEMALAEAGPNDEVRGALEEIRAAAQHSAELTHQLLAFARRQTASPRVLDLNETIAGMLSMLGRLIGEHIVLDWSPAPDLWPVRMDPGQVRQVLTNLCVNARDAMDGGGRLAIATTNHLVTTAPAPGAVPPGAYVSLCVSDTGTGMSPDVVAHVFEPFFTTKALGQGTGLGLATVYGIVKQNGGHVSVDSAPGRGTTVRLLLPRAQAAAEPAATAASFPAPTCRATPRSGSGDRTPSPAPRAPGSSPNWPRSPATWSCQSGTTRRSTRRGSTATSARTTWTP